MDIQTANLLVLIITAGILVWYTKETYRLRKESERQTELMLRPFVIAEFVFTKELINTVFKVHNIGNGAATNIQITADEGWLIEIPFLAKPGGIRMGHSGRLL